MLFDDQFFLALSRKGTVPQSCLCHDCVGHPTFSIGVGPGPGDFDLATALRVQPFEDTATFRGVSQWTDHYWSEDVPTHFLVKKLCDNARAVWESTFSNE